MIVKQIDYDGATGRVTITFHPDGIKTIAMENRPEHVETASQSKPVSVDFQFSIKQRGRGAKKRIVEAAAPSDEPKLSARTHTSHLALHACDPLRGSHPTRRETTIADRRFWACDQSTRDAGREFPVATAPEIQEQLLFMETTVAPVELIQLKWLQAVATDFNWEGQRKHWKSLRV
ncbi:MAG: hypothetical protein R3C53_25680 [Pirellulaceae bacterium]